MTGFQRKIGEIVIRKRATTHQCQALYMPYLHSYREIMYGKYPAQRLAQRCTVIIIVPHYNKLAKEVLIVSI